MKSPRTVCRMCFWTSLATARRTSFEFQAFPRWRRQPSSPRSILEAIQHHRWDQRFSVDSPHCQHAGTNQRFHGASLLEGGDARLSGGDRNAGLSPANSVAYYAPPSLHVVAFWKCFQPHLVTRKGTLMGWVGVTHGQGNLHGSDLTFNFALLGILNICALDSKVYRFNLLRCSAPCSILETQPIPNEPSCATTWWPNWVPIADTFCDLWFTSVQYRSWPDSLSFQYNAIWCSLGAEGLNELKIPWGASPVPVRSQPSAPDLCEPPPKLTLACKNNSD